MRRLFVLALLFVGLQLIQPLGTSGFGSDSLLTFGFLILGAYAAGELAAGVGIPQLVGYLIAGVVFGPYALGTVSSDSVHALAPVSSLAIALIAFLAGAELRWEEIRARGGIVFRVLASELGLTLVVITGLLAAFHHYIPFLGDGPLPDVIAFSLVFASIAIVHSPAVAMALLTETRARGPVARTSLGLVLLSDVVIVLLLIGTLTVAQLLVPPHGATAGTLTLGAIAWEIGGAVIVGAALGGLVTLYLRVLRRELFLFAIVIAFFGSELARLTHVEPLITLIVAGFVAENVSVQAHAAALRHAMERAAEPVFVVFFALAGADIVLPDLARFWPLVLPLALVRGASIWTGCRIGLRWAKVGAEERPMLEWHVWSALIPQAGVAIGLAATVAATYPNRGGQIRTFFLALVALNQLVGPILFRRGLARAGEIPDAPAAAEVLPPAPEAA